jgi:hypothetical protein
MSEDADAGPVKHDSAASLSRHYGRVRRGRDRGIIDRARHDFCRKNMKTLYFDIDGTILLNDQNAVKAHLGSGRFETAVRKAGFTSLVCVGNFCAIAQGIKELGIGYDELGILYGLCRGAFQDETWLRNNTVLINDPRNRADFIDYSSDWWYVDDLAQYYMEIVGKANIYQENPGGRICAPSPNGDGKDVLEWLIKTTL